MRYLLLLTLLLSGCASTKPVFKKGPRGYNVVDVISSTAFVVTSELPPRTESKYIELYGIRAVGEECKSRGYDYFDFAVREPESIEGYCFKTPDKPGLGVEFSLAGLSVRPEKFVITDLNGKTKTLLQVKDEILEIEGKVPKNVAAIKAQVYRASMTNQKTLDLKIKRGDDEIQIKEPIALFKNSTMGPTQLDLLRSRTD